MMKLNAWGVALLLGLTVSCTSEKQVPAADPAAFVNPFIGTGGHGHTFPGAVVPHGMIQPSPDTRIYGWDACSGYHYSDRTINGFSHTHVSGTGCCDYGDVLLMPTVGEQKYHPMGLESQQTAYASAFSHENEHAEPGYYSVFLDTYGVKAELTASTRAAMHRYTFPAHAESGFILDLDYSLERQTNQEMELEVISDTEIVGRKKTVYWAFDQVINFYAKFSKPFTYKLVTDSVAPQPGAAKLPVAKVLINFETTRDEEVLVKVGVSAVDIDGARRNVESEIPHWDFERVRAGARASWNDYLSKINIKTGDEEQRTVFYTALYHTAIAPTVFSDVDGRYRGMDQKNHAGDPEKPIYTVFSLWDTFRAYHPLMTIIDPAKNNEFINSLLAKHDEGGILPMWDLGSNYTGTMIGYHAVSVIVDAYMKGYRNFDVQKAYEACLRTAEYDTTGIICPDLVLPHLMPQAKYYKNKIGYVPCNKDNESVAKALEYAYNDWCIAEFAKALGDQENAAKYTRFAGAYETYFDKSTRFMRGLDSDGNWRTPFSPLASTHRNDDYCEGTAWQWTWFVPHQVDGLVRLMGGEEAFIGKLDSLFTAPTVLEGNTVSADISGLIGQYAHGNEPSHHITHLYNYVKQPWKTQALVDSIFHSQYRNATDGISGNEDCGQMSSWYILNSMGFYQVCPGKPLYSIGRPLFDEVTIKLPDEKHFVIRTENNSRTNRYIKSVVLNGAPLATPFFSHETLAAGGEMVITMSDVPTEWGTL